MTNKVKGAGEAYNLLTNYMDMANYAGNNFAVTSADIGEALQRSASFMKANGTSLSQGVAMVIGANETIQDASKVGNALKSITSNLNAVTFSAKEEELMLNKTAKALKNLGGINVADMQKGTIKSAFNVLDELHDKWNTYTETEKAGLTEAIGMKYHANVLQAMLDNWDTVLQFQEEYNEGFMVGSAQRENERFVDSLEGRIVALNDQFRQLVTTTITSDMAKGVVGGLATGVEGINSFLTALDKINMATPVAIGTIATLFNTIKTSATGSQLNVLGKGLFDNIKKQQTQVTVLSNNMQNASQRMRTVVSNNTNIMAQNVSSNTARIQGYLNSSSKNFRVYAKDTSGQMTAVKDTLNRATISATSTTRSFSQMAKSMVTSTLKSTAMNVGISLLNGALISLAVGGISIAIKALDDYIHKTEKAYESQQDAIQQTQAKINDLNSNRTSLKSMSKDFEELSNKINLSAEEADRLAGYKQEIATMFPDLVVGYDEAGSPIIAMANDMDALIEKTDTAIKKEKELLQMQNASSAENAGKLVGKYRTNKNVDIIDEAFSKTSQTPFFNATGIGTQLRSLEEGSKKYIKIYEDFSKKIESINMDNATKNAKYSEYEMQQQQAVIDKMTSGKYQNFTALGETQKAQMYTLIDLYDWSNELVAENISKRNEFMEGFDKISKYAVDNYKDVEKWNKTLSDANNIYQKTGSITEYQKAIQGVAEQLEAITGIDANDWLVGFTQQLDGTLSETDIRLSQFLAGFGKNLIDLNIDKDGVAIRLKQQFEDLQSYMQTMTSQDISVEQKIDLITKIGRNEDNLTNLPPQLRAIIAGITDGGDEVTEIERQVIAHLATVIETEGSLNDTEQNRLLMSLFNGELTSAEISAGITLQDGTRLNSAVLAQINKIQKNKDNQIKVDLNEDYLEKQLEEIEKKIEKFNKVDSNEKVRSLFTDGIIDTSKLELVNQMLKDMPFGENTIDLICNLGGDFNNENIKTYSDVVKFLLENPSVASNLNIKVVGKDAIDAVKKKLDGVMTTDEEKKIAIRIEEGMASGDINAIRDALDDLDEEKQIKIATDIADALKNIKTVDAQAIRDKIVSTYLDTTDVENKIDEIQSKDTEKSVIFRTEGFGTTKEQLIEIDENGKPVFKMFKFLPENYNDTKQKITDVENHSKTEKKTIVIQTNGFSATIQQEKEVSNKAKDESKTVTFKGIMTAGLQSILAVLGGWTAGKSATVKFGKSGSVEEFKNISNTPVENIAPVAPLTAPSDVGVSSLSEGGEAPPSGSGDVSASATSSFGNIGTIASQKTTIDLTSSRLIYALEKSIKIFQELENRISRCANQLALLDKQMERATGTKKIEHLKKQNELYEEQAKLQKEYYDTLSTNQSAIANELTKKYGFNINEQGNLIKYDETMINMQKQYDALEKTYEKAQKAESDYTGSSESKKKSLSKTTENAKNKLDEYKEKMDKVNTLTEEYINLQYNELPKANQEWQDMKNSIEENNDEIEKLLREDKLYKFKNSVTALTNEFEILGNTLDLLNAKIEYANGKERIDLYDKQIDALEEQRQNIQKTIDKYNEMIAVYKDSLSSYGVEFDKNNNIVNQEEVLNKYQNTDDLEKVTELMEEYLSLQTGELPEVITQWEDLGNQIKSIQNEKLEVVKDVEDKITAIYEDQLQKRKDKIQEEKDATVKALEEQKQAYQDYRSEASYKDDYDEQLNKINKLRDKIAILERDTSLASRSKLQEAYDELAEEEKALKELQQNRLDEQIESMYDKEIEKAEEDSDKKIKDLEEIWTSQKIAELVAQDLGTNTFTDIDGNVKSLQDTMIEFAETSGEAIGIMGDTIKNDLVNNLQSAMDVLQQYSDIYNSLGLKQYGTNYKDMYDKNNSSNATLQVGDINIQIQGDATKEVTDDMIKAIDEELKYISNRL